MEKVLDRTALLSRLPKNGFVAELGVLSGDYSREILEYNSPEKLYLVDWWDEPENPWPNKNLAKFFHLQVKILFRDNPRVEIVKGDVERFLKEVEYKYFDWVYIDLDHSYQNTKDVLKLCESKIKPGGYIAGHDFTESEGFGVIQAVNEFCEENRWVIKYLTDEPNGYHSFVLEKK